MAKTTIKKTKYGDTYNTRYYTTWKGMIVSKRSLQNAKAKKDITIGLINSITKNNQKAFMERPDEDVSGLENPKLFLKEMKETLKEKRSKGQNSLQRFGKEFERIQRTNIFSTEEERLGSSFGEIMRKSMNKVEREDLRRFMGWSKGFDLNKEGFKWNKDEKRFEKEFFIDGDRKIKYIYINYTPRQRYGEGKIEYGTE